MPRPRVPEESEQTEGPGADATAAGVRGKAEQALLEQDGLWAYCDDTQDLNPPCFPPNLRHLEERLSSPVTSPSTAPVHTGIQHQTCQNCFFQTSPAPPTEPEHPPTDPACQKEEGFPCNPQVSGRRETPPSPTDTDRACPELGRRIQPALCQLRWSRCCRRGSSAALPCKEERKHKAANELREPHICSAAWKEPAMLLSHVGEKEKRWEAFLYDPTGQDTLLGNASMPQCTHRSFSSLHEMGQCFQPRGLNCWSLLWEVARSLCSLLGEGLPQEQHAQAGEQRCTYLSHMSKMKRQKEPTAMGPTCFQYPERRFRSFWS